MVEENEEYLCHLEDNSIITTWSNKNQHDEILTSSASVQYANNAIITTAVPSIYESEVNDDCYTADTIIDSNETTQYFALSDISLENLAALSEIPLDKFQLLEEDITTLAENEDPITGISKIEEEIHEPDLNIQDINESIDIHNQVLVFAINDELYGIQFIPDNDNPEKMRQYQFKLKTAADGSLQIIPNTLQLSTGRTLDVTDESGNQLEVIMSPQQAPDNFSSDLQETIPKTEQDNNYFLIETHDKEDEILNNSDEEILHINGHQQGANENVIMQNSSQSMESTNILVINEDRAEMNNSNDEGTVLHSAEHGCDFFNVNDGEVQNRTLVSNIEMLHDPLSITHEMQEDEDEVKFECKLDRATSEICSFYKENYEAETVNIFEVENDNILKNNGLVKHKEFLQLLEDISVTDNKRSSDTIVNKHISTSTSSSNSCSILKHSPMNNIKLNKNQEINAGPSKSPISSDLKYYIIYPEKENLNSAIGGQNITTVPMVHTEIQRINKTNSRSLLKKSFTTKVNQCYPETFNSKFQAAEQCNDIFHKRFARSKEATQAKLFQNFINKTTIPQAPLRQVRQPRKQKIMPIIRTNVDEEIIVEEVLIGSTGFIKDHNFKRRKTENKLSPESAAIIVQEISDSESDSPTLKNKKKKKRFKNTRRKRKLSIIEVSSSDDNDDGGDCINNDNSSKVANSKVDGRTSQRTKPQSVGEAIEKPPEVIKRKRGRPPKYSSQIESLRKRKCIEIIECAAESVNDKNSKISTDKPKEQKCSKTVSNKPRLRAHRKRAYSRSPKTK